MSRRQILTAILLLYLASGAEADVFIRNKLVPSSPNQTTAYVSSGELSKYFTPEELKRIELDPRNGLVLVDGVPLDTPLRPESEHDVPIIDLALALGFQKRVNLQLGITDYVSSDALEGKEYPEYTPQRRADEYRAASERLSQVTRANPRPYRHPQVERVQRIGESVAAHSEMHRLQWKFVIVADPRPNVFCTGTGWVGVTEGLLALDLNDDELAGVLAHEVAHGCRRDIEVHAATWGEQQDFATAGEFQKQVEIDADQRGLRYAIDAGYSAYGLMSV